MSFDQCEEMSERGQFNRYYFNSDNTLKPMSVKKQGAYNLRSSFATPSFRTKVTLGDRSFQVAAPKLWNALPREIRALKNIELNFKVPFEDISF